MRPTEDGVSVHGLSEAGVSPSHEINVSVYRPPVSEVSLLYRPAKDGVSLYRSTEAGDSVYRPT